MLNNPVSGVSLRKDTRYGTNNPVSGVSLRTDTRHGEIFSVLYDYTFERFLHGSIILRSVTRIEQLVFVGHVTARYSVRARNSAEHYLCRV